MAKREQKLKKVDEYPQSVQDVATNLGIRLLGEFREREQARWPYEQRWLKDLRQVKGIYEPEIYAALKDDERSRAFLRLTRSKTYTLLARLMDLLFPANGDKNWEVEPTELPDIPDYLAQEAAQIVQTELAQMAQVGPEAMQGFDQDARLNEVAKELAKRASTLMGEEMEDQLSDGRQRYRSTIRKIVRSAIWYGSGFLKGPMVDRKTIKRWGMDPQQVDPATGQPIQPSWSMQEQEVDRPYFTDVSVWNVYPDMSVSDLYEGTGIFERHVVTRHELAMVISKQPKFDAGKIKEYLSAMPDGDYESKDFEDTLLNLADERDSDGYTVPKGKRRYELIEFWGFVSGKELAEAGMEMPEEDMTEEFRANIWMLGPVVVKAVLNPFDGIDLPYYAFYFDKDESSVFGEGVPSTMRDIQSLFNAAIRAAADNAAMASGPVGECNVDMLAAGEDPEDVRPRKIFLRKGRNGDAQFPAFRWFTIPSNVCEFMEFARFIQDYGDETTNIPRFLQGESQGVKGAGKTASGLSMLMGAANISLSDLVKGFDDGITIPFITALYQWNMQFNPRDDIKGDMLVKARGSTALMAKEQRAMAINNLLNGFGQSPYLKQDELLRDMVVAMDLPADRVRSDDEVKEAQAQEQAPLEQAIQQLMGNLQELSQRQEQSEQTMGQAVQQIGQQVQSLARAFATIQNQAQGY